jgi:hypothetical protein
MTNHSPQGMKEHGNYLGTSNRRQIGYRFLHYALWLLSYSFRIHQDATG